MIRHFIKLDRNGRILSKCSAAVEYTDALISSGMLLVEAPAPADATHFVDGGYSVVAAEDDSTYKQKRVREYPPITEYVDAIVNNSPSQLKAYLEACRAVKRKYPKPSKIMNGAARQMLLLTGWGEGNRANPH